MQCAIGDEKVETAILEAVVWSGQSSPLDTAILETVVWAALLSRHGRPRETVAQKYEGFLDFYFSIPLPALP